MNSYLDILRKDLVEDPDQSWIHMQGTYSLTYFRFFKWLAYPELTPQERKRVPREKLPEVVKNLVRPVKKGSKSPIKAKNMWNDEDNANFLKYYKDNPRLRFYHELAMETSGRPGELLQLRIGDISNNMDSWANGKLYSPLDMALTGKRSIVE